MTFMFDTSVNDDDPDWDAVTNSLREWMVKEMSDISEELWFAGWLDGLEEIVWDTTRDPIEPLVCGLSVIPVERLRRLKRVSEFLDEWPIREKSGVTVVSLSEWQERLEARQA